MKRAYLELHIAVLLFGFTAILGKLITLDALPLVWWRVFITSISLFVVIGPRRITRHLTRSLIKKYLSIGVLVGIHWVTFFMSVKMANVSVALVAFSTQAFFTSLIEPLVVKRRVSPLEIALGVIIIPAMFLIVSQVEIGFKIGFWIGVLSALLMAVFVSFSKKLITTGTPLQISFYQLAGATIFLTILLPFSGDLHFDKFIPRGSDIIYLLALSLLCTTLAYVLSMRALRYISAFASNLAVNLEPVYGICLAMILFKEHLQMNTGFVIGAIVMITAVFTYPIVRMKNRKKRARHAQSNNS